MSSRYRPPTWAYGLLLAVAVVALGASFILSRQDTVTVAAAIQALAAVLILVLTVNLARTADQALETTAEQARAMREARGER